MKCTANISFLSEAEKLTLLAYHAPRKYSVTASEIMSRIAAAILLSPAAMLDIVTHTSLLLPIFTYSLGKFIYHKQADFNLPWQHLQRIRNAVAPLLLGSPFGIIHSFAGLAMSEPTDKHIILGMLSSNTNQDFETPCSPVHSLSLIEELALAHRYVKKGNIQKEIFSPEHVKIIRDAKNFEKTLEFLQAQEYIHKITNVTLFVMAKIKIGIDNSNLSPRIKNISVRLSGMLVPILTSIDIAITLFTQSFFLITGLIRLVSGRGPIYTEVTTNPLMHVCFFIQNILKSVGNLIGTPVWFVSPKTGFKVSLLLANAFFKMQMNLLMLNIKFKMHFAKKNSRFVIPIVYGNGTCSALSIPTHSMHKTYLIIEKKEKLFNLYWVNRPTVSVRRNLKPQSALTQIKSMLDERFPFMDLTKIMNYPVISKQPKFPSVVNFMTIAKQGNSTNCVVSNLFGTLRALDEIRGEDTEVSKLRYKTIRKSLMKKYSFYKDGFFPFTSLSNGYSLTNTWKNIAAYHKAII